ncbi:MAG TPA: ABC transporter permease [Kofleriaceae bacterium]|nr:ABC transporter permease [Kofleriaceae bacterium]
MGSLWLDVRYALRMMVKTPGLTAVLAITLALGIGASTTIFSVVNSVVLRPLPYEQPDQMVRVYTEFHGQLGLKRFWVSGPEYDDLRKQCRTCKSVAAWSRGTASLAGGDRPVRIEAAYATANLLPLLGVKPILGRWFDESEDGPGGDPTVVVLGYDVWKRAFGGDKRIVGRSIHLDAMPVTVIGVMPPGFDFLDREEAWVPLHLDVSKTNRGGHFLSVVVRLGNGATLKTFQDDLAALRIEWAKLRAPGVHAISDEGHPMVGVQFHEDLVGGLATTLWLLQGAVLLVLLISIVNVANLLLARSETRTREVAVRHALGASRTRLMRQFLTESMLLAIFGGGLGVLVAVWALDGVTALIPKSAPRANEINLDVRSVVFAVACAIGAALLFGMAPILHARRTNLYSALKDGSNRMTASRTRLRVRRALVIGEIALAVLLVIGCTVMVRSFLKLQQVQLGMKPDHLLTFEIELPEKTYPGTTGAQFWKRLEDRLRTLPGVTHATLLDGMPPSRPINANDIDFPDKTQPIQLPGYGVPWNVDYWQEVGDDMEATLGARIVRGRPIQASDTADAPSVVLINEAFAKKFFRDEDPIGQRVMLWGRGHADPKMPRQTIVGVVADIKQAGIDKPAGTEVFLPWQQYQQLGEKPEDFRAPTSLFAVVRTTGNPTALTASIHHVVADLDPSLPVSQLRSMDDVMWEAVARPRFLTFLLATFAGIALLLAAVGIYGVMAHTVAQRTHEIGLRVALGAQPAQVRAMVLRQAATLVAAGVAIGLGAAIGLQQLLDVSLQNLFYGERMSQPVLLAGVAIAVTITALLATWIPARRATKVEPTVALRSE